MCAGETHPANVSTAGHAGLGPSRGPVNENLDAATASRGGDEGLPLLTETLDAELDDIALA